MVGLQPVALQLQPLAQVRTDGERFVGGGGAVRVPASRLRAGDGPSVGVGLGKGRARR